jgi:hypothetical protein
MTPVIILGIPGIKSWLAKQIGGAETFWANFAFLGIGIDR